MKLSATIEIRPAQPADAVRIREIWRLCFGDTDRYIDFFLNGRFVPEETLLCAVNGKVVSQLFLLPAALRAGADCFPAYYLFAAATDPAYQRRGLMERLLHEAETFAASENKRAIVLLPGEESLYSYYAKHGYRTAFYRRVLHVSREQLRQMTVGVPSAAASDPAAFLPLFLQARDGLEWDAPAIDYAIREHRLFRGDVVCTDGACVCIEDDTATVLAPPAGCMQGLSVLSSRACAAQYTVVLPPDAPFGTLCNGGMIRWIGESVPLQNAFLCFPMA